MIRRIYIEITNLCNLHCSFCAVHHRSPRSMSLQEFEHILQEASHITKYIYLHVQGEPLMHPQFEEIMDLCDACNMQVQIVTNGTLLEKHMQMYEHPSLRKISFSLQSLPFSTNDIHAYTDNILAFCEASSARGRPYAELRFWRSDENENERVRYFLQEAEKRYSFQYAKRKNSFSPMKNVYITFANEFEWPDENMGTPKETGTCLGGLQQIAVLSGGTVVPCCLDYDGKIPLGNVFQQPLSEILESQRYLDLTEGFRRHRLKEELCRTCTFRKRFDQKTRKAISS